MEEIKESVARPPPPTHQRMTTFAFSSINMYTGYKMILRIKSVTILFKLWGNMLVTWNNNSLIKLQCLTVRHQCYKYEYVNMTYVLLKWNENFFISFLFTNSNFLVYDTKETLHTFTSNHTKRMSASLQYSK